MNRTMSKVYGSAASACRKGGACVRAAGAVAALVVAVPVMAADGSRPAGRIELAAARGTELHQPAAQVSPYVRYLALLINEYRADRGLPSLELASELSALASEHSSQMAEHRLLSHDGFRNRFDRTRARVCVENVGVNFPHAKAQLDGWRESPGHQRNLLEPKIVRMGIAKSEGFVTFFACS